MTAPAEDPYSPPRAPEASAASAEHGSAGAQEFRWDAPGIQAQRRRALIRTLTTAVLGGGLGIAMGRYAVPNPSWIYAAVVAVLFIGGGLVGALRGMKQLTGILESYRLYVWSDRLERTQSNLPKLEISRRAVLRIEEHAEGLSVYGPGTVGVFVPASISGFSGLRAQLATWRPIERRPVRAWLSSGAAVATLIAMLISFYPEKGPVTRVAAVVSAVGLPLLLWSIRRRTADPKQRRRLLLALLWVSFMLGSRALYMAIG